LKNSFSFKAGVGNDKNNQQLLLKNQMLYSKKVFAEFKDVFSKRNLGF
jgi:hypothetical protein